MDPVQLTIVIISFILTVLIVILGIQVWHILKEFRRGLEKMNKMLDDAGRVSGTVSEGISGMSTLLTGLKAGLSLFSQIRNKKEGDE